MTTNEQLSDLIGLIYDCVIEPDRWSETMRAIGRAINGHSGGIVLFDLSGSNHRIVKQWDVAAAWEARQVEFFDDMTQLYRSAPNIPTQSIDEPLVLSRDVPRAIWANTRLYQEWAKPQGLCDSLQSIVLRDANRIGVFATHRHESQGDATEEDIAALRLLAPHIRRAITISDLLDLKLLEHQALVATLDHVAAGVIVVAGEERILHANESAQRMLASGGPLRAVRDRLAAREPAARDELRRAIAVAQRNEAEIGAAGIGVALSSDFAEPVIAHVLPLAHGDLRTRLIPQATAAIFVTPAPGAPAPGLGAIAASLGLTEAEARLLEQLVRGATLAAAAGTLGIAETTAKTHLSHIFSKTGVSRQADLIALIHRLAPPLRQPLKDPS